MAAVCSSYQAAEKSIRNDECAVGAVYFLRLRAGALALRGPAGSL